VSTADPNLPILESVVNALGPLCERFVFVGGCATGLLVTVGGGPPVRATRDVDVIVEVLSLVEYHDLERQLERAGFRHDLSKDAPICRWLGGGAMLDVMPTDQKILGFGNRWYDEAVRTASLRALPGAQRVRLIAAPVFVATKLEAFAGRGGGDYLASHDLEDVINVVDGRAELVDEVGTSSAGLRDYLAAELRTLLADPRFVEALPAHLSGDRASQARVPVITERLRRISESA
jgi:predicted nucleotidyltransferase